MQVPPARRTPDPGASSWPGIRDMIGHGLCLPRLYRSLEGRIEPNAWRARLPRIVSPPFEKHLRQGVEKGHARFSLHEQKLTRWIHLEKDVLFRRRQNEIDRAKDEPEVSYQPLAAILDEPRQRHGLECQIARSAAGAALCLSPVDLPASGRLRVDPNREDSATDDRDAHLVALFDVVL